jgi:hypothetical protein
LLGWFGASLAAVMVVLGFTVAIVMTRFDITVLHQKGVDSFLSIPFVDMIVFGSCMAMAVYWRKKPEYHRRLVFIASCHLMDAAVARFDFIFNHGLFYLVLDCLIVFGIVRDWVVDGRVHKVYLYALPRNRCCAEFCNLHVAGQSGMVGGDHSLDPGTLTDHTKV